MRHRTRKSGKLTIVLLVLFLVCAVTLLFYAEGPFTVVSSRVSLPDHLYSYIILPVLYFLAGYVVSWLVFLKGNVSFSGGMRALLLFLAILAIILILFSTVLYFLYYTGVGDVVKLNLPSTLIRIVIDITRQEVVLFACGTFLYYGA